MKIDNTRLMASRIKSVVLKCEEMALWYLANNSGIPAKELCEDAKSYGGIVLRWLDPPIPGIANPVLIERYEGDHWVLKMEERDL